MKRLGSFVTGTVRALKAEEALKLHRLKSAWLSAVGEFVGSQTEPVKLKNKTLYLVVSSPMWAQEVKMQQPLILKNLRGLLPEPPTKITCWVGDPHAKKSYGPANQEVEEGEFVPWKEIEIPPDRLAKIEDTVKSVEDDSIKEKLRNLLKLSVQREIYLIEQGQLPCPVCGAFRDPEEELCPSCDRERRQEEERKIFRLLAERPWSTTQDLMERTPGVTRARFMKIRKQLLADLMLSAWQRTDGMEGEELIESMDEELRTLLMDITMLRCSLPAHSLKPKHFYFALGKRLAKGYLEGD